MDLAMTEYTNVSVPESSGKSSLYTYIASQLQKKMPEEMVRLAQAFEDEGRKEEAEKAQASAKALFSAGNAANMPTAELDDEDFTDGKIDILTLLAKSGLVPSKSEGRRAVQQGGVAMEGEKVEDIMTTFNKEDFAGEGKVLRRGKKNFRKIVLK